MECISEEDFYLTPGFVNAHLHPNQLYDRGLLDDLSIVNLLSNMHTKYNKTDEDRYIQALYTLMDALKSGATSIYAVASEPDPVIKAFKTLNLTGAITCFFNDQWEGAGQSPKITSIYEVEKLFATLYEKYNNTNVKIHIGSASVQCASNELICLFNTIAKKYNTKVNIHISEGIESIETCIKHRGTTPVRLLEKLNVLNERWNLIHATTIDIDEVEIIARSGASVIHCPVSNAKTGVGVAPILDMLKKQINIGLGTDACSNNNTNNILNEAYFAKLLHNALHKNPVLITDQILTRWLTANSYNMLNIDQNGTLEIKQKGNLLIWSLQNPSFVPLIYGNFNSTIFNNAPDLKPHTVILNGDIVVNNYKFNNLLENKIQKEVNIRANKLMGYIPEKMMIT
jgi:5-methylthioadenosine/S-adenosylhomocysteine deaminase